jgi:hypothetical protein
MSNDATPGTEAVVTSAGNGVRLRKAAHLNSTVLATLASGTLITVDGGLENGYAGVTTADRLSGFAFFPYLAKRADNRPVGKIARVKSDGDGLRLRAAPRLSATTLAMMGADAILADLSDQADGFLAVSYEGLSGFASERFVRRGTEANPWAYGEDKLPADWGPVDRWRPNVDQVINRIRADYGIAPHKHRVLATIYIESRGFPDAIQRNPLGDAYGLMQLTRNAWTAKQIDFNRIMEPDYNIFCGTRELTVRHNAFQANPSPRCSNQPPWDAASYGYFGGDPCGHGLCDPVTGTCPGPYHDLLQRLMRALEALEGIASGVVSEAVEVVEAADPTDLLPNAIHNEAQARAWFGRVVTADAVHEFNPADEITREWVAYGRETGLWAPLKGVEQTKDAHYFRFENGLTIVKDAAGTRVVR